MEASHSSLVLTLGGIAFFIYGLHIASESLQRLAADRIRDLITVLSRKSYRGVLLGVALTLIFQSSGAVTSMLVGLGSAGVISIAQVMSVILGTAVGSTLTVQILSFDIAKFGLPIFALGFFVHFLSRNKHLKTAMLAMAGFGLIFWGLEMIRVGTATLQSFGLFNDLLAVLVGNPFYTILITAVFTAIFHSSAVTIGIAMTLVSHGSIDLADSIYWIYGANIGTTAVALIASTEANSVGRQVAWAHCFYKLASVALFFPFSHAFVSLIETGNLARDVANINTGYNVIAALIFFPGVNYGARLMQKLFPPTEEERAFTVKYLNKENWESPSVAIARAEREILRMADIVNQMISDSLDLFRKDDSEQIIRMRKQDDHVDLLSRELSLYLAQHLDRAPAGFQKHMMRQLNFVSDLESAADVVENQLLELASKKHKLKLEFSKEGWEELKVLSDATRQIADMSVACFQTQDKELAERVVTHKRYIRKLEERMRESHISRLVKGKPESINTSSIHLDVLGEYRRIVGLYSNHVYPLIPPDIVYKRD